MTLSNFFDDVVPVFRGLASVDTLHARWDFPTLQDDGLRFYQGLLRANVHRVMDNLFARLKSFLDATDPNAFSTWVDAYRAAHPPTGHDLNALAAAFPTFLRDAAANGHCPAWWAEAADWAFTLYVLRTAPAAEGRSLLPFTLCAFDHAVPGWDGSLAPPPRPVVALAWRAAEDDKPRWRTVDGHVALAAAAAVGLVTPPDSPALRAAEAYLVDLKILRARTATE